MAAVTVEETHRLARIEAALEGGQTGVWRSILSERPPRHLRDRRPVEPHIGQVENLSGDSLIANGQGQCFRHIVDADHIRGRGLADGFAPPNVAENVAPQRGLDPGLDAIERGARRWCSFQKRLGIHTNAFQLRP